MRKLLLTTVLAGALVVLHGQHETLFGNLDVSGAFGGPILEVSSIVGETGADVGGGGALVMEHLFFGGYGLGNEFSEFEVKEGDAAGRYDVKFGHGGFWLGLVPRQYKLIHFYGSARLGWGRARLRQDKDTRYSDRMFVVTPEVGFEVNLTDYFKLGFTGGYRWVTGIDKLPELGNEDFSSPIGMLTFRFGGFDDW